MTTLVGSPGAARTIAGRERALAGLAFATRSAPAASGLSISRHLAFLPPDALALDLSKPEERDFGDYELIELLGQGGMGVVYRARQKSLARDVAVKLLAAGPWASAEFIARFEREAQHAAQLNHPNIVPIFEIGEHEGLHFFSMALVRGTTLAGRVATEGPLAPRDAARIVRTVAEALSYAHALGVLHLDLKPANVLIDERGSPLVADFGLARRLDQALGIESDEVSGTPSYMAPEQAQLKAHPLSPATDIWGLGAILYECLTGRPPFLGATPRDTLMEVVTGAVERPRALDGRIPLDLEAVVLKCLAKEPRERYGDARALADDLGRFLEGRAVGVRPLTTPQRIARFARREPRLAVAIGSSILSLVVGLGFATQQWQRAESGAHEARTKLWRDRLDASWRAIEGGGALAALPSLVETLAEQEAEREDAAAARTRTRIAAVLAASPQPAGAIAVGEPLTALALASDASFAAVAGARGIVHVIDPGSGKVRCRVDLADSRGSWPERSIERLRIAAGDRWIVAAPFGPDVPPDPRNEAAVVDPRDCSLPLARGLGRDAAVVGVAEDASHAVVRRTRAGTSRDRIVRTADGVTVGAEIESIDRIAEGEVQGASWHLAPGLAHVVTSDDAWRRIDVRDPATLAVTRTHRRPEANGVTPVLRASAWSPDGRALALAWSDGVIESFDPVSGAADVLDAHGADPAHALRFSRDGVRVSASFGDGRVATWDMATLQPVARAVGGRDPFVHALPGVGSNTVFVHDDHGAALYALVPRRDPAALWHAPRQPHAVAAHGYAWSEGARVLATADSTGGVHFFRVPDAAPLGTGAPPLAANESEPAFDGRHVAWVEGASVAIADLAEHRFASPPIMLPQAVSFAFAAPTRGAIVTTAGSRLSLHRGSDAARLLDVELPESPGRVLPEPDDAGVLVVYNEYDASQGNGTVLERYSLDSGARTGRVRLEGFGWHTYRGGAGRFVMAWRLGTLRVFDARSLAEPHSPIAVGPDARAALRDYYAPPGALGARPPQLGGPRVLVADIDPAGGWLWVLVETDASVAARLLARPTLHAIELAPRGRRREFAIDGWVGTIRALPREQCMLMQADLGTLRFVDVEGAQRTVTLPRPNAYAGTSLSADGTRLAVALERGVAVLDVANGEWITPPLQLALEPDDVVVGVALDAHGTTVLARTRQRGWWRAELTPDSRGVGALAALARGDAPELAAEPVAIRTPPPSLSLPEGTPPAAPSASPRFVDLGAACTQPSAESMTGRRMSLTIGRMLPPGRHRLLGVDYAVDCGVGATMHGGSLPGDVRTKELVPALSRFAALDLLMTGRTIVLARDDATYAILELRYADGVRERRPIHYRRDVWEFWMPHDAETQARIAWDGHASRDAESGSTMPVLFHVRVANPRPAHDVVAIVLEATSVQWSAPLLLGMTLVPVDAGRATP